VPDAQTRMGLEDVDSESVSGFRWVDGFIFRLVKLPHQYPLVADFWKYCGSVKCSEFCFTCRNALSCM